MSESESCVPVYIYLSLSLSLSFFLSIYLSIFLFACVFGMEEWSVSNLCTIVTSFPSSTLLHLCNHVCVLPLLSHALAV